MRDRQLFTFLALLATVGCGGSHASDNATSGPAASESAEATASESPSPSIEPSAGATTAPATTSSVAAPEGTPTPVTVPTPTPDPNLLSTANGTILRSYSPVGLDRMSDGSLGNASYGIGSELPDDAKPPYIFTFELPGITKIDSFEAHMRAAPHDSDPPSTVQIAVSSTGADSGFKDLGTLAVDATGTKKTLTAGAEARWVRLTANRLFDSVAAFGTLATPPPALNAAGTYIEQPVPDINGGFVMSGTKADAARARIVVVGSEMTGTLCDDRSFSWQYVGSVSGRNWNATFTGNKDGNPDTIRAVVNDDASIIAGVFSQGQPVVFMRTAVEPKFCVTRSTGTGAHRVLVLDRDAYPELYPIEAAPPIPGYTFDEIATGMLQASDLAGHETAIVRGACTLPEVIGRGQLAMLLQWVAAGHKLIVAGRSCNDGGDFSWLPYPLKTAGSGPESENASLIQVENSGLGTNDKNDSAHFIDVATAVAHQNALSAALPAMTSDPHWCGHFFVAKTTNLNGFAQTYAVDGKGLLIYDGFNGDDGAAFLQTLRRLELDLPVPSNLPCTQTSTDPFVMEPSQEGTFAAGTSGSSRWLMNVLANQGWNGHVTVSVTGGLPATVTPASFDIAGGVVQVATTVKTPASAKAGVYTLDVVAKNGAKTAHASIVLTGIAQIRKAAIAKHQRIRIYGIHFDIDSARIQPRSEPVIADIANLMQSNRAWRFEVSGHTDSDGGAAYNLGLSQRRAQSVVDDLAKRYHVARSRMVAKGYGLARPVATNATDAGKALNRRVELERLQ